jgi:hypothetical protein
MELTKMTSGLGELGRSTSEVGIAGELISHESVTESVTEFLLSDGKPVRFRKRKCGIQRDLRFAEGPHTVEVRGSTRSSLGKCL